MNPTCDFKIGDRVSLPNARFGTFWTGNDEWANGTVTHVGTERDNWFGEVPWIEVTFDEADIPKMGSPFTAVDHRSMHLVARIDDNAN